MTNLTKVFTVLNYNYTVTQRVIEKERERKRERGQKRERQRMKETVTYQLKKNFMPSFIFVQFFNC